MVLLLLSGLVTRIHGNGISGVVEVAATVVDDVAVAVVVAVVVAAAAAVPLSPCHYTGCPRIMLALCKKIVLKMPTYFWTTLYTTTALGII